jgi:hypothetical protein
VEGLNREGQWIVMMGFLVSLGIFFLAVIISQSTLVGQTTAEGVLEFPKNDIQDIRHEILGVERFERDKSPSTQVMDNIQQEIRNISLYRMNANVWYNLSPNPCTGSSTKRVVNIHYNNGVTVYNETTQVYYVPC